MKRNELLLGIIKLPLEFFLVYACFFLSRNLREIDNIIPWMQIPWQTISNANLSVFALIGSLLYVVILAIRGGYHIHTLPAFYGEFKKVISSSIYWFFIFIAIVFLGNGYLYTTEIPRLVILYALLFISVVISLERYLLVFLYEYLLKIGAISKKTLLFIGFPQEGALLDEINSTKSFSLLGYTDSDKHIPQEDEEANSLPYLSQQEAISLISERKCDEILMLANDFSSENTRELFEYARIYGVRFRLVANMFEYTKMNTSLVFFGAVPAVEIKNIKISPWGRIAKRIFDLFGSIIGIILFSPVMAIIALLIKKEEPHAPVVYVNRRVGKDGKLIDIYKFRYMKWEYCVKDAYGIKAEDDAGLKLEQELIKKQNTRDGAIYKIKDDPRKTKIGAFIEKTSLDELPQLFNVLSGDMSLVGPRPHQPREVEKYREHQKRVLTVKPGITGMAQVFGRHKNTDDQEVELDTFYIENWSMLLDCKLILRTVGVMIRE